MKEQTSEFVRREIVLDAPREEVWTLVSDPRELATWLADDVALDAIEPGAEGVVTVENGERRHTVVEDVEPGRRIALRWTAMDDADPRSPRDDTDPNDADPRPAVGDTEGADAHETLVELTLDDCPGRRTRLVVVEIPMTAVRAVSDGFVNAPPTTGPTMAASHATVTGPAMATRPPTALAGACR